MLQIQLYNHNKNKIDKVVWTANQEGHKILVNRLATDAEEGRHVASSIFEFKMQEQRKNSDFAILYRTNAQSRAMEDALRKRIFLIEFMVDFHFTNVKKLRMYWLI